MDEVGDRATVERYTEVFFRKNVRSYPERYPGRDREFDAMVDRIVRDDPRWVMTPVYTVLPMAQ